MQNNNWEATLKARRDGLIPGFGAYERAQTDEEPATKPATKKPATKKPATKKPATKKAR